jgi:hypothetical protein
MGLTLNMSVGKTNKTFAGRNNIENHNVRCYSPWKSIKPELMVPDKIHGLGRKHVDGNQCFDALLIEFGCGVPGLVYVYFEQGLKERLCHNIVFGITVCCVHTLTRTFQPENHHARAALKFIALCKVWKPAHATTRNPAADEVAPPEIRKRPS